MVDTIEVVNIVASGNLGREIDVQAVGKDVDQEVVDFPEGEYSNPVVYLRREEDGPMVTLFRSGSYHVTGAKSVEEARQYTDWAVGVLRELGVELKEPSFEVKNVVGVGDIGNEVNLEALAIQLGFERVEYEPEQFPGLIFKSDELPCVILVFSSGSVILTGSSTINEIHNSFDRFISMLNE